MKKQLTLMLVLVLLVTGCTPAEKPSKPSGFKSVKALGESIFSALQSKDPDNLVALYADFDELLALKKAMIESVDDPLQKIKIEKSFSEDLSREEWDRQRATLFDDIYQFLVSIDDGKREVSFEQIKEGTLLGLAPFRVSGERLSERFGVDSNTVGWALSSSAQLFFEHDGVVFLITIDNLLKINHRWYLAGDYFRIELLRSVEDVRFRAEGSPDPEAERVRRSVLSHFAKISNAEYAAKVERHLDNYGRRQLRPQIDISRGNTTQSD